MIFIKDSFEFSKVHQVLQYYAVEARKQFTM